MLRPDKERGWAEARRAALLLIVMAMALSGCGGGGGTGRGTPTPAVGLPAGTQEAGSTPGAPAAETPIVSGNVTLQMISPHDGDTVSAKDIQVQGVTSAGAVVSVNDAILIAGADGRFETTVTLEEGPNLIEVIASDDAGDEAAVDLAVTYEP